MVILTLLEPEKQTPLQQWRFDNESVIRIGRSPDNQVVLEHDKISRSHIELRQVSSTQWQLISRGTNGTFIDGNQVEQTSMSDGTQFQLARGGPLLKFQLQATAARQTVAQPQPPSSTAQVLPTNEQVQLQARFEQLTQERSQLQAQLEQATVEKTQLQATVNAIATQFPVSSLQEQQQESAARLAELQHTSAALQAETTFVQSLPQHAERPDLVTLTKLEQKRLLDTLSLMSGNLEKQRLQTSQSQQQLVKALQALQQLEAHLKANQTLANQLPTKESGTDTLITTIQQNLKELDQELARIHELYSASQTKKNFGF